MIFLRVIIGISAALVALCWIGLMMVGKALTWGRAGSGREDLLANSMIIGVPVLSLLMLISTFLPTARTYMHVVAVPVALMFLTMIWVATESRGTAVLGFGYFGLWLVYYWQAVWR